MDVLQVVLTFRQPQLAILLLFYTPYHR